MLESKVLRFIDKWTDEKRHPVVVDNEDMERAADAMIEMETIRDFHAQMGDLFGYFRVMRVIIEVIYCMGFEAGRQAERQDSELQFGEEPPR